MNNLKKNNLVTVIPVSILTLISFVGALIALLTYGKCGSEFNGGKVSGNVMGLGTAGVILSGVALLVYIAAFFFAKNRKLAHLFALARIGNYALFVLGLGAFLFQILDEYSLIGTILYPIVSGTVGDPVDPVLVANYFSSLIILFTTILISLAAGIVMRKMSHRILKEEKKEESEVTANE